MAKKNFKSGIDKLIQSSKDNIETENTEKKTKKEPTYQKATYYLNAELLEKTKAVAYYERLPIGRLIDKCLEDYLKGYGNIDSAIEQYKTK